MEKTLVTILDVGVSSKVGGGNLAVQADIVNLVEGSLAMLNYYKDGSVLPYGVAVPATDGIPEFVTLALGRKVGANPHLTTPLYANKFKVTLTQYQAGVAMVGVFGNDALTAKSSGSFASGDINNSYTCTTVGTGTFGTYLVDSKGTPVSNGAGLTLNEVYTVVATGSPTWNSAVLTPTSINNALVVGTKTVGLEYGVTFVDLTKDINERRKYDITLPVLDSSISNTQMLTNLVAAINAHPQVSLMGTATRIGAVGFKFVATDYTKIFTMLPLGIFAGTSIAVAGEGLGLMPVPAVGAYEEVLESERRGSFSEGRVGTADKYYPIWKGEANTVSGQTYDCISIQQTHVSGDRGYPVSHAPAGTSDILIYYPSSDRADYATILAELQLYADTANYQYDVLSAAITTAESDANDYTDTELAAHTLLEVGTTEGTAHTGLVE